MGGGTAGDVKNNGGGVNDQRGRFYAAELSG